MSDSLFWPFTASEGLISVELPRADWYHTRAQSNLDCRLLWYQWQMTVLTFPGSEGLISVELTGVIS